MSVLCVLVFAFGCSDGDDAPSPASSGGMATSTGGGTSADGGATGTGGSDPGTDPGQTTGGSGTTDPSTGTGGTAPTEPGGTAIVPTDGWVDGSNAFGVIGPIYTYKADAATVTPESFTGADICVAGSIPKVTSWESGWGAGIGFHFNDSGTGELPLDTVAAGLAGFRFAVQGATVPPQLLMKVRQEGVEQDNPCMYYVGPGPHEVRFAEMRTKCEVDGFVGSPPDATKLVALDILIVGSEEHAVDFDFCLTPIAGLSL
jgi:hypothetical protein